MRGLVKARSDFSPTAMSPESWYQRLHHQRVLRHWKSVSGNYRRTPLKQKVHRTEDCLTNGDQAKLVGKVFRRGSRFYLDNLNHGAGACLQAIFKS